MTARYSAELFSSAHTVDGSEIGTIQTTNKQEETVIPPAVYLDFLYQIKLTSPWKMN